MSARALRHQRLKQPLEHGGVPDALSACVATSGAERIVVNLENRRLVDRRREPAGAGECPGVGADGARQALGRPSRGRRAQNPLRGLGDAIAQADNRPSCAQRLRARRPPRRAAAPRAPPHASAPHRSRRSSPAVARRAIAAGPRAKRRISPPARGCVSGRRTPGSRRSGRHEGKRRRETRVNVRGRSWKLTAVIPA